MTANELLEKYKELCYSIDYNITSVSDYDEGLMFDKIIEKFVKSKTLKDAQKIMSLLVFNSDNEERFSSLIRHNFDDWKHLSLLHKESFDNFVSEDKVCFFLTDFLTEDSKGCLCLSSSNPKEENTVTYKRRKYYFKYQDKEYLLKSSILNNNKFTITDIKTKKKINLKYNAKQGLLFDKNNVGLEIIDNKDTCFIYEKDYINSLTNRKKADERKALAMIECCRAIDDEKCPYFIIKSTINKNCNDKALIITISLILLLVLRTIDQCDLDDELLTGLLLGGMIFRN